MTTSTEVYEKLIRKAARRLKGHQRRLFQAEVADALCQGSPRAAERRFGFDRNAVTTGQREALSGIRCAENFAARAKPPVELKDPQLAADVRAIVEPHTLADPEVKSARRYTNLSAREVLQAYHSKYNPIEHCWGVLEQKWGGTLLSSLKVILQEARRMTWCGQTPTVKRLHGDYPDGVRLTRSQMKPYEKRLKRSATLPKYDVTITPIQGVRQVG